jgi:hypothetical protein
MEGTKMKTFAVINQENLVVNVICADSKEIAEDITKLLCIENEEGLGAIGDTYNDGIFEKPLSLIATE